MGVPTIVQRLCEKKMNERMYLYPDRARSIRGKEENQVVLHMVRLFGLVVYIYLCTIRDEHKQKERKKHKLNYGG